MDKEVIEKYVKSGGWFCPYCHSDRINWRGNILAEDEGVSQLVECDDCGKKWYDMYKLVGIEEAEE